MVFAGDESGRFGGSRRKDGDTTGPTIGPHVVVGSSLLLSFKKIPFSAFS